jgi:AcrR family transcriptional regulator
VSQPVPLRARKKERTRAAIARVALDLFSTRGFSAVTLAEIAEAAEVGQRTLFRYFADKEELLFDDDGAGQAGLRAAMDNRPEQEPPATAVLEALLSLVSVWQDQREQGRRRREVIDASPALRARERAKHAAYQETLLAGLTARGLDRAQGRLLAGVAVACVEEALSRWYADVSPGSPGLLDRLRQTFAELAELLGEIGPSALSRRSPR